MIIEECEASLSQSVQMLDLKHGCFQVILKSQRCKIIIKKAVTKPKLIESWASVNQSFVLVSLSSIRTFPFVWIITLKPKGFTDDLKQRCP